MNEITGIDVESRINYHPPTDEAKQRHDAVRILIANAMNGMTRELPDCREATLVLEKLEEAMFWANAGIARNHDKL